MEAPAVIRVARRRACSPRVFRATLPRTGASTAQTIAGTGLGRVPPRDGRPSGELDGEKAGRDTAGQLRLHRVGVRPLSRGSPVGSRRVARLLRGLRVGWTRAGRGGSAGGGDRRGRVRPGARLPRIRPPHRPHRPSGREPRLARAPRPRELRPVRGRPRSRGGPAPVRGRVPGHAAPAHRGSAPHLLRHARRRVHGHSGQGAPRVAGAAHGTAARPARARPRGARPDPRVAARRRRFRAVPPRQVRRTEALLARGRGDARADAGNPGRVGGGARRRAAGAGHAASRPDQRARPPDEEAAGTRLRRVRIELRAARRSGARRREVSPRLLELPREPVGPHRAPRPQLQPQPSRVREPRGPGLGAGPPGIHGRPRARPRGAGADPR